MRSKRFTAGVVGGVVGGLLLGLLSAGLLRRLPGSPVNRHAFAQVQKGMTRPQVEAVLGGPPGAYTTRPPFAFTMRDRAEGEDLYLWQGDEGVAAIVFDRAGRVADAFFADRPPQPEAVWDQLPRWLGL